MDPKISITKIQLCQYEIWDRIWEDCNYATYFQSREWAEIWAAYSRIKFRPEPVLITFSDGKKAMFPLSAFINFKGLKKEYICSYATTFGGWISAEELTIEHAVLLRRYLTNKIRFSLANSLVWRLNPFDELSVKSCPSFSSEDTTVAVNLSPGFDAILASSSSSHRRNYRQAEKHEITVTVASTLEEWKQYYEAYQDSIRRWGEKCLGELEWDAFFQMFQLNSPNIKLWVASHEGQVIAGALCFYSSKNVAYWHGASHSHYLHLRPATLLHFRIIRDSCKRGYDWYDFGPSAGLQGNETFKRRFGGTELRCPLIVIDNNLKFKILLRNLLRLVKINVGGSGLSVCD